MNDSIYFYFYGVIVKVTPSDGEAGKILDELVQDFRYFYRKERLSEALIEFTLASSSETFSPRRIPVFRNRLCSVYGLGRFRFSDYGENSSVTSWNRGSRRIFRVRSSDLRRLHELTYFALLSSVGEELEVRGYVRLHALGLRVQEGACVFLMPSGSGKSSLASFLIRDGRKEALYSDEIVLVRKGVVFPFPIRLALKEEVANTLGMALEKGRPFERKIFGKKILFEIPRSAVSTPAPLAWIGFGRRTGLGGIHFTPKIHDRIKAAASLFLGLGLPQMTEHFLRIDAVHRWAKIAYYRLEFAAKILASNSVIEVALSGKPHIDFQILESIMEMTHSIYVR